MIPMFEIMYDVQVNLCIRLIWLSAPLTEEEIILRKEFEDQMKCLEIFFIQYIKDHVKGQQERALNEFYNTLSLNKPH